MTSKKMLAMVLAVMMSLTVLVMPVSAEGAANKDDSIISNEKIADRKVTILEDRIVITTTYKTHDFSTAELKQIFPEANISSVKDVLLREQCRRYNVVPESLRGDSEPIQAFHKYFEEDESEVNLLVYSDGSKKVYGIDGGTVTRAGPSAGIGGGSSVHYPMAANYTNRRLYFRDDSYNNWNMDFQRIEYSDLIDYTRYNGGAMIDRVSNAPTMENTATRTSGTISPANKVTYSFNVKLDIGGYYATQYWMYLTFDASTEYAGFSGPYID